MSLRRCPACKNMIASETIICPVCGVDPKKRQIQRIVTWVLVLAACAFGVSRMMTLRAPQSTTVRAASAPGGS